MTTTADQEISILTEIGNILASTLELRDVFGKMMQIISDKLNMHRGALVLLDESTGRLRTEAAAGLTPDEIERGKYALGEGITGNVVATGRARLIPDLRAEPDFLNRTGRLQPDVAARSASCASRSASRVARPGPCRSTSRSRATTSSAATWRSSPSSPPSWPRRSRSTAWSSARRRNCWRRTPSSGPRSATGTGWRTSSATRPAMHDVFATVGQVANSRATVLLLGETGTGKEMIAKATHYNSPRKDKPFVRVNCGALTGTLLESELFGHVKGSFTGAIRDKIGRFEAADGGTIFLDEIGTLEPQLQVKLLRVLQEREFERVGDTQTVKADVRVIAATNVDLQEEVAKNNFREDLFYRLNVVPIYLPPLRNRREDIPRLIDYFLDKYNAVNDRKLRRISRDMLNVLLRYPWPGNVRELENAIERAVVLSNAEDFNEELLPLSVRMFAAQRRTTQSSESIESLTKRLADQAVIDYELREGEIYQLVIDRIEHALIDKALNKCNGVKTKAADFLGINRNTLNKKVKELGIETVE